VVFIHAAYPGPRAGLAQSSSGARVLWHTEAMTSVILLPGLACDDELFAHQAPALAALGCRVHISNAHTRKPSLPDMAAALLAEHPGQHLLVGASMGGMVAMEMHRQAPDRVLGLGLLGTTARPDTPELIALRTQACAPRRPVRPRWWRATSP
jgi:pimeloyl-ACP methyl ester carboxylesterase